MSRQAVEIRFARESEGALVSSVLVEAATWLAQRGAPLWSIEQLGPEAVAVDVAAGRYVLATVETEVVGTARFAREDADCWPDAVPGVAAYVHRVAIRRAWAGRGLPGRVLGWCATHAEQLGCSYLRLDCDASRPKLRALYEGLGFRFHGERRVGHYTVARYERSVQWDGSPLLDGSVGVKAKASRGGV
jgi:GNAT superfamily N-acetyltransferase